jgi:chromosome segregation ATPase
MEGNNRRKKIKDVLFGLSKNKEIIIRDRSEAAKEVALYEKKLAQYREVLDSFEKSLMEYSQRLECYSSDFTENRKTITQSAIDISCLREQGDRVNTILESISTTLEGMDKNVVSQLSELLEELKKQLVFRDKQVQIEQAAMMDTVTIKVKKGQRILCFIFIFCLINMAGLAFLILKNLGIIVF